MATANTKSTYITNADASPPTHTAPGIAHGRLHSSVATLAVAAADDDTSTYRLLRLHSSWTVRHIWLWNDAITSGTDYNLGLYATAGDGGADVDENLFGDAISMANARTTAPLDAAWEILDIANIEKAIWELLGLSTDPGRWYDLVLTGITVGTAAGDISVEAQYVAND